MLNNNDKLGLNLNMYADGKIK